MGLQAKKSLGQHFLRSHRFLSAIAAAGDLAPDDTVLEIGPGEGTLTRELLSRVRKVIAIEKDHRMVPLLNTLFATEIKAKRLSIVHGDILSVDISDLNLKKGKYKVVANIPYYISGALFRLFLESGTQPSSVTFLVQKEVAERIARSKKESLLSLSVKAYGTPLYVSKVPRGAFVPPPSVDSAILTIRDISRARFSGKKHEEAFFKLIHAGFAHKRKKLGKALTPYIGEAADRVKDARAEDISITTWLELAKNVQK